MKKHIRIEFDIDSETAEITNMIMERIIGTDENGFTYKTETIRRDEADSINNTCEEIGKALTWYELDDMGM